MDSCNEVSENMDCVYTENFWEGLGVSRGAVSWKGRWNQGRRVFLRMEKSWLYLTVLSSCLKAYVKKRGAEGDEDIKGKLSWRKFPNFVCLICIFLQ